MKITNKFDLPEPLVEAVRDDRYSRGSSDYSATDLIKPVQAVALERRHEDEIEKDVSDMLWALYGKIVHDILERSDQGKLKERRLYDYIDGIADGQSVCLSGKYDRCVLIQRHGKLILQDWKMTTVWAHILDNGLKPDWVKQLNIYSYLLQRNGYEVDALEICALFRDWQRSKAEIDSSYPPNSIMVYDLPHWGIYTTLDIIRNDLQQLHEAERMSDAELAEKLPCSDEDRWFRPGKFAVYRNQNKTASRLCDSRKHAEQYIEWAIANKKFKPTDTINIEERPGVNNRCQHYCDAAPWCHQRKALGVHLHNHEGEEV